MRRGRLKISQKKKKICYLYLLCRSNQIINQWLLSDIYAIMLSRPFRVTP